MPYISFSIALSLAWLDAVNKFWSGTLFSEEKPAEKAE